jgi:hypothetical protein
MFKLLPLLLLTALLSFVGLTDALIEGNTICETTSGSPLTTELWDYTHLGIGSGFACRQNSNGANGRPGCTLCGHFTGRGLKISICGVKGSSFGPGQVKEAVGYLARGCTRTFRGSRDSKTGGKWRDKGGKFTILVHL